MANGSERRLAAGFPAVCCLELAAWNERLLGNAEQVQRDADDEDDAGEQEKHLLLRLKGSAEGCAGPVQTPQHVPQSSTEPWKHSERSKRLYRQQVVAFIYPVCV